MASGSRRARSALLLLALFAASPSAAADWRSGGVARVVAVIDGDTVALHDGRELRLVGIQAPELPREGPPWPLAEDARAALADLVLGHEVRLSFGGLEADRHGRTLAHAYTDDGTWVQGEMLRRGLARVYSFADNRGAVREMLAIEAAARVARRGIWALETYAVRTPETAGAYLHRYEIVEGVVVAADEVNGRVYLNFGKDWRTDFTVSLSRRDARRFRAEGIEPLAFEGQRIRVRGWVDDFNGPMMDITHPERIEWPVP